MEALKNKEFRPTKSLEEHNENARNKIEELKTQNISHGSQTVNNPYEHSIHQQKSTKKTGNNVSQSISLLARLRQIINKNSQ